MWQPQPIPFGWPCDVIHTYITWYSVAMIPIKFILWLSTVCLHQATYVYIPYRFYAPYNANKSIFVYLHGFFNIYIYICCHIYIINNNNLHGFFICIYIYIYICPSIFNTYVYINISICFFIGIYCWPSKSFSMRSQSVATRCTHDHSMDYFL